MKSSIRIFLVGLGLFAFSAHAALVGRAPLTPGGTDFQAYYDDVLNITWLADASFAATSGFTSNPDGRMTYDESLAFIDHLNNTQHLGVTGWRLPMMNDLGQPCETPEQRSNPDGTSCGYNVNTDTAELASMYYDTLGMEAFFQTDGSINPGHWSQTGFNPGPFENLRQSGSGLYWYALEYTPDSSFAWYFGMPSGGQGIQAKTNLHHAWAVVDADPIPLPAAVWLFGCALGVLGWLRRRSTMSKAA